MGQGRASSKKAARLNAGRPSAYEPASIKHKKHAVLGQRERGRAESTVQPCKRTKEIRLQTLLVEHQQQGRTNVFVDRRFGEGDESLPQEDKLISRFQRERQRQACSSKFALAEEEGNNLELTHGGRALGEMEDGEIADEADLGHDEVDEGAERLAGGFGSSNFIKAVHFGVGKGAEVTAKKTLEEAIAQHKLARHGRKELKVQERSLVEQLDADFSEIRRLIFASSLTTGVPKGATPAPAKKLEFRGDKAQASVVWDDFDTTMRLLGGEMRAQPSDRLLNDSERVIIEQQRLEKLELERLHRMQAASERQEGGHRLTDDDLTETLALHIAPRLELRDGKLQLHDGNNGCVAVVEDKEDVKEAEVEEEEDCGEEAREEVREEIEDTELDDEEVPGSEQEGKKEGKEQGKEQGKQEGQDVTYGSAKSSELPYVFACPRTQKELDKLLALAKGSVRKRPPLPPPYSSSPPRPFIPSPLPPTTPAIQFHPD